MRPGDSMIFNSLIFIKQNIIWHGKFNKNLQNIKMTTNICVSIRISDHTYILTLH